MKRLEEICNEQANGETAICNGIFSSGDRHGLTYKEYYAANFIDANAKGIPSSVPADR
jgi:hypothetical protein